MGVGEAGKPVPAFQPLIESAEAPPSPQPAAPPCFDWIPRHLSGLHARVEKITEAYRFVRGRWVSAEWGGRAGLI